MIYVNSKVFKHGRGTTRLTNEAAGRVSKTLARHLDYITGSHSVIVGAAEKNSFTAESTM